MNANYFQREIRTRHVPLLKIDNLIFKDLNKNGILDPYEDWRLPVEIRVEDLINRMTLEEKAGLMVHPWIKMGPNGEIADDTERFGLATTEAILNRHIRHFLNNEVNSPFVMARWSNEVQALAEQSRLGIPVNFSSDPRHHIKSHREEFTVRTDRFSKWPEPIGLAATGDVELVQLFGVIAAREYRAVGIHTALHPQADLATEPRWPRINGTFGEDAELVTKLVRAYISGFQGKHLGNKSVACMTKHWPGGGPQENGTDPHLSYGKLQIYPGGNFDYHLLPFVEGAIKAGTAAIMPYYGIPAGIDSVGMCYSKRIIKQLLREKYGFNGVVCTDWEVITRMPWGVESLSEVERYQWILEAGCDQIGGDSRPEFIVELVRSGEVSENRINESVRRLLKNMFLLGLFENPYVDPEMAEKVVGCPEHIEAGKRAQRESIVLLKNKDGILPLSRGTRIYIPRILVSEGDFPPQLDGKIVRDYGCLVEDPSIADCAVIKINAPYKINPQSGVFAFHEGTLAYEDADNAFHLFMVRDVVEKMAGSPVVVSVYMDRPAILSEFIDNVHCVLVTFGVSDEALLDVLFGRFNPRGRLPFNLPRDMASVERQLADVSHDLENPLFKFRYGLSYGWSNDYQSDD